MPAVPPVTGGYWEVIWLHPGKVIWKWARYEAGLGLWLQKCCSGTHVCATEDGICAWSLEEQDSLCICLLFPSGLSSEMCLISSDLPPSVSITWYPLQVLSRTADWLKWTRWEDFADTEVPLEQAPSTYALILMHIECPIQDFIGTVPLIWWLQ